MLSLIAVVATLGSSSIEAGRIIFAPPEAILQSHLGARALAVGDADGDGDLDVFVGFLDYENSSDTVGWLENDGHPGHPSFSYHLVPFGLSEIVMSVATADFDGDGDLDFSIGTTGFFGGSHDWFENDGLVPPGFAHWNLEIQGMRTFSVIAVDMDKDTDLDLVGAHPVFDRISWQENAPQFPGRFALRIVTDDPDGPFLPREGAANGVVDVYAADIDADGDIDIVSANAQNHTVTWFVNDGASPPSFEGRLIDGSARRARDVVAVDIDLDGDVDVVACSESDDTIAWHESDGAPEPAFSKHIIVADPDGSAGPQNGFADNPISIVAVDLDGDGDVDIVSSSDRNNLIAWYENDGRPMPTFTPRVITTGVFRPGQVVVADLDDDGDLDVLTASQAFSAPDTPRVVWIENRATLPHGKGGKHWRGSGRDAPLKTRP